MKKTNTITSTKPALFNLGKEITSLFIQNITGNNEHAENLQLKYTLSNQNGQSIEDKINILSYINIKEAYHKSKWDDTGLVGDLELPLKNIKFELIGLNEEDDDVEYAITLQMQNCISIEKPGSRFKEHLDNSDNTKILFSAPFGQGKTTFLNLFFDQYQEQYNTFHLFPVNYSIAENKDIFEYIKCSILYKLLERDDVNFDKEKFSYLDTLGPFALKNGAKIIAPFLRLIPNVGGSLYKIYDNLNELANEYFKKYEEVQLDERKQAIDYISSFIEKEGSIYEDNFFTQLIRQLLSQIKETTEKENVLVIDDLDRMDPDHVFRILNVFAAHFDNEESYECANKFGFDKVIVVCDYSNLEKIFSHRYGEMTDFAGYINKFFSKSIFRYDNLETALSIIRHIKPFDPSLGSFVGLQTILTDLFISESLTLRELLKLKKNRQSEISMTDNTVLYHISTLHFLTSVFDLDTLTKRIKNNLIHYNSAAISREFNYNRYTKDALVQLHCKNKANSNVCFELNNESFRMDVVDSDNINFRNAFYCKSIEIKSKIGSYSKYERTFTAQDFYTVLLLLIEKNKNSIISNKPPIISY